MPITRFRLFLILFCAIILILLLDLFLGQEYIVRLPFYMWTNVIDFPDPFNYLSGVKAIMDGSITDVISRVDVLHGIAGIFIGGIVAKAANNAYFGYSVLFFGLHIISVIVWYNVFRRTLKEHPRWFVVIIAILIVLTVSPIYRVFTTVPATILIGLSLLYYDKYKFRPLYYFVTTFLIGLFHTYSMLQWFVMLSSAMLFDFVFVSNQTQWKLIVRNITSGLMGVVLWSIMWMSIEFYIGGETLEEARKRIGIAIGHILPGTPIRSTLETISITALVFLMIILTRNYWNTLHAFTIGSATSSLASFHTLITGMLIQNFHFTQYGMMYTFLFAILLLITYISNKNILTKTLKQTKYYILIAITIILTIILARNVLIPKVTKHIYVFSELRYNYNLYMQNTFSLRREVQPYAKLLFPWSCFKLLLDEQRKDVVILNLLAFDISSMLVELFSIGHDYSLSDTTYYKIWSLNKLATDSLSWTSDTDSLIIHRVFGDYCAFALQHEIFDSYVYSLTICDLAKTNILTTCKKYKRCIKVLKHALKNKRYKDCRERYNHKYCFNLSYAYKTYLCIDSISEFSTPIKIKVFKSVKNDIDKAIQELSIDGIILTEEVVSYWQKHCKLCQFEKAHAISIISGKIYYIVPIYNP